MDRSPSPAVSTVSCICGGCQPCDPPAWGTDRREACESSGDDRASSGDEGRESPVPRRARVSRNRENDPPVGREKTVETVKDCLKQVSAKFGTARGPLFDTRSLAPFRRLGHGVPIAYLEGATPFDRAESSKEFRRRLKASDRVIATLPFREWGIVLAGGSVSAHLMRKQEGLSERDYDDYDIFLVGHSAQSALEVIRKIHAALASAEETQRERRRGWSRACPEGPVVYRTDGCMTYHSERLGLKVQVVLRIYKTVEEVLNGFDLGSSAMAWDGESLLFTFAGLLAANHGANVVNLVAKRQTYEARLAKYFRRGFDIVLPGLNVQALEDGGYRLPYLGLTPVRDTKGECDCRCRLPCYEVSPALRVAPVSGAASPSPGLYDATVPYGSPDRVRLRNYREGQKPEGPNVRALCGFAPYAPEMDYGAIAPEYPAPSAFVREAIKCCSGDIIRVGDLRRICGEAATKDYVAQYMERVFPLPKGDRFGAIEAILLALFEARVSGLPLLKLPLVFQVGAPDPAGNVTDRQWYGAAYSRSFLDSARGLSLGEGLERERAFAEGREAPPVGREAPPVGAPRVDVRRD